MIKQFTLGDISPRDGTASLVRIEYTALYPNHDAHRNIDAFPLPFAARAISNSNEIPSPTHLPAKLMFSFLKTSVQITTCQARSVAPASDPGLNKPFLRVH